MPQPLEPRAVLTRAALRCPALPCAALQVNPTWMKNNCNLSCKYCVHGADGGYLK